MKHENLTYKEKVLDIINRVYNNGLTTTSGGNISAIDENDVIYITPSGIDKGTLRAEDIVTVLPDGQRIGKYAPSMELPFHSNIYKMRNDLRAVVHAHAPSVVAYATANVLPELNVARCFKDSIKKVANSCYALPGSIALGDIVKEKFIEGYDIVMMANHGATAGGANLSDAYRKYDMLELCCQTLINARLLGGYKNVKNFVCEPKKINLIEKLEVSEEEREVRKAIITFVKRSYAQRLINSGVGTFAVRLSDNSFIFNPDSADRLTVTENDLIKYKNGALSKNCTSVYIDLISDIFTNNSEVKTIFISSPQNVMGFAVSGHPFNSKLIPESYLMLKDVQRFSADDLYENREIIVKTLGTTKPVGIIDNDCAVTLGKNLTKAFDRMEVLEYSCKSVIQAKQIAMIVPISEDEVKVIDNTFNGW